MIKARYNNIPRADKSITSYMVGQMPPGWTNWSADTIQYFTPAFVQSAEFCSESQHGYQFWHSFSHYRRDVSFGDIPAAIVVMPEWQIAGSGGKIYRWGSKWEFPVTVAPCSYGSLDKPDIGLDSMYSNTEEDLLINPPVDLNASLQSALQRLLPGIRPSLSLLNSVYELKDMKSLLHSYSSVRDTMLRAAKWKNPKTGLTIAQSYGKLSILEVNRRVGSEYLQYKFNLAPLLSDLKGLFKSFVNYEEQARRLLSQADRVNRRHIVINVAPGQLAPEEVDPTFLPYNVSTTPTVWNIYVRSHRQVELEPVQLHVEVEYSYSISDYERLHANSLALLDMLGIGGLGSPAIIWNAAPWTFVVDWVLGIGRKLDQYKVPGLQPVVNIRRCLWSIKRTRHIRVAMDINDQRSLPASRVTETAYRRDVFTPTMSSITSSGLSPTEVSLGYALATTRGRAQKREHFKLPW